MASAVLEIVAQFSLHESYVPALLRWKVARERKGHSNSALYSVLDLELNKRQHKAKVSVLVEASRPGLFMHNASSSLANLLVMYLLLDPALLLLSLYYAFVFGVLYLVIVSVGSALLLISAEDTDIKQFHIVFGDNGYGHSPGVVGVDLISEGVGAMIGMVGTSKVMEIVYKKQDKSKYKAESR